VRRTFIPVILPPSALIKCVAPEQLRYFNKLLSVMRRENGKSNQFG
jgi:hypothetical protein